MRPAQKVDENQILTGKSRYIRIKRRKSWLNQDESTHFQTEIQDTSAGLSSAYVLVNSKRTLFVN